MIWLMIFLLEHQDCVNCHCGKRIEPVFGKRMQHGNFKHPWPASPSERRKSQNAVFRRRDFMVPVTIQSAIFVPILAVAQVINVLVRHHNHNDPYHPCMVYLPIYLHLITFGCFQ